MYIICMYNVIMREAAHEICNVNVNVNVRVEMNILFFKFCYYSPR
jgi:hypothetical protein